MRLQATITALAKATTDGKSLRTTVPSFIVAQLKLGPGDRFKWELREASDGLYIVIRPFSEEKVMKMTEKTEIQMVSLVAPHND